MSKTAIAYLRVSTDQTRQELGAQAQRDAIQAWAGKNGFEILAWHLEQVSGGASLDRRPVLLQALADVEAHRANALVVSKLDRFSRDPLTAALAEQALKRSGASLMVADGAGQGDDPTSKLIRGILLSVAEFEKAMIRARIKAALQVKKDRGELTGSAPFGFKRGQDGKTLVPCPEEQKVINRARALRQDGESYRRIEAQLAREGFTGRTGQAIKLPTIHQIAK